MGRCASPLYDWTNNDVWAAYYKFGYEYNKLYDLYYKALFFVKSAELLGQILLRHFVTIMMKWITQIDNIWALYEALQERFHFLFQEFENIYVSFSGGKDSGSFCNDNDEMDYSD